MFQQKIGIEIDIIPNNNRRVRSNNLSNKRNDKFKQFLKEWNTIADIELYKDLYKICCQLFNETFDKKLACLNYYIDHERDNENGEEFTVMYAEIKDTWQLEMKERYNLHKKLLKRVMSNDTTLIYCNSETQKEEEGQLSLFG